MTKFNVQYSGCMIPVRKFVMSNVITSSQSQLQSQSEIASSLRTSHYYLVGCAVVARSLVRAFDLGGKKRRGKGGKGYAEIWKKNR